MKKEEKKDKVVSIENGLEIVKNKSLINRKEKKGPGRKTREKSLTNYGKAVKMLDDSVEFALDTMIRGLEHPDPYVWYKCAEFLINKSILNKKNTETREPEISKEDIEIAVGEVLEMIRNG